MRWLWWVLDRLEYYWRYYARAGREREQLGADGCGAVDRSSWQEVVMAATMDIRGRGACWDDR